MSAIITPWSDGQIRIMEFPTGTDHIEPAENAEEMYRKYWFEPVSKRFRLMVPGASVEKGITFSWAQGIQEMHGHRADFTDEGILGRIRYDPNYYKHAEESQRKWTVFHEFEHAMSYLIETYSGAIITETAPLGKDLEPDESLLSPGAISSTPIQVKLYNTLFGNGYLGLYTGPNGEWIFNEVESVDKAGGTETMLEVIPANWDWAVRPEEKRAEMKNLMRFHGNGAMTEELLSRLCAEKETAMQFEWHTASKEEVLSFIKAPRLLRLDILMLLRCDIDSSTLIDAANQLVKLPVHQTVEVPEALSTRVSTASAANDLIRLANALDTIGCIKEANRIDEIIKLSDDTDAAYPAPTYSSRWGSEMVVQQVSVECPSIRTGVVSSHGRGLVEWQQLAIEIDPGQSIHVPVTTTGRGVLDIFLDALTRKDDLRVAAGPGLRVKTRSRTRGMLQLDLRSRYFSIGRSNEGYTGPVESGFTVTNISDEHIRFTVEASCFPSECAGRRCMEWVKSYMPEEAPPAEAPATETTTEALIESIEPPPEPAPELSEEWRSGLYPPGDPFWHGRLLDPLESRPWDAFDEIIYPDDYGEWM